MTTGDERRGEREVVAGGVGFTALLVTAGRAVETNRADGLVDDPWAERFVDAAPTPVRLATRSDQPWPRGTARLTPELEREREEFWALLCAYMGVRSRYFDEALTAAAERGIDQVVLLAAGLDARAVRLPWPGGTTVYEIDQAEVLAFKDGVFAAHGARPGGDRRTVGVDLREDWVSALLAAGFAPERPSVWLAEGLLPFLPAAAEKALFEAVDAQAAPGSVVAVEHFSPLFEDPRALPLMASVIAPFGVVADGLLSTEPRTEPAARLTALGWTVAVDRAADLARRYGRPFPAVPLPMTSVLMTATKR